MTLTRLLLRNLFFHRRANLAVLLGVAVGAAVLTGALLVGDSLRGSLRDRALKQLNGIESALVSGRFLHEDLAKQLAVGKAAEIQPALLLRGTAAAGAAQEGVGGRVEKVTVIGVPSEEYTQTRYRASIPPWRPSWRIWEWIPAFRPNPNLIFWTLPLNFANPDSAWLPASVARDLGVHEGDQIELRLQKASDVPRESLLGRRDPENVVSSLSFRVEWVMADDLPASQFNLTPGTGTPRNVYVLLPTLQEKFGQPGRANTLFAREGDSESLQKKLHQYLTLDDWGLTLHTPTERTDSLFAKLDANKDGRLDPREYRGRLAESVVTAMGGGTLTREQVLAYYRQKGYVSLESRQMIVEPTVERAALETAQELNLHAAPTLVYLANAIGDGKHSIPYSTVAALDPSLPAPLGPFLPPGEKPLADDEILLADWKESPLTAKPGDPITLTYFEPEQEGRLKETTATFKLRALVPLTGVADPDLTPEFPGITDKLSLQEWNPPFPYDNSRVKKPDEDYWNRYRTTPKAYVTLAAGQKLFGSRFGQITSIRLAPTPASVGRDPPDLDTLASEFGKRLLANLDPAAAGMAFEDVRERALRASSGGTDFGGLFLGFSFFLIAAALMLVGLLFRLNLERRASEIGVLLATGYRTRTVRRLLLAEGGLLAAVGGLVGLAGAVGYSALMLKLLAALWPDPEVGSFLQLHVTGQSLAIGYGAALLVSLLTVAWAVRVLGKVAPSALLAGVTAPENVPAAVRPVRWRTWVIVGCVVAAVGCGVGGHFTQNQEARAGSFFSSGALLLIAALTGVWSWLRGARHGTIRPGESFPLARLGVRNAARFPVRSLLTAGLLASAAFLLVAVESFRRSPDADFLAKDGGSGGFALVAESDLPLYHDLNTDVGRQDVLDALEKVYQRDPATKAAKLDDAQKLLAVTTFAGFRVQAGDDASCLNLYQPGRPRILGVPRSLIERGGFRFAATAPLQNNENAWQLMANADLGLQGAAIGEANTVHWILKSGLNKHVEVSDGSGAPYWLRIVGLLQDSVFQSELLISEAEFLRRFPRQEGYQFFLIAPPAGQEQAIRTLLETALADRGFAVTPARDRLAAYLAVENTYLSTFQVLGGFGLLLGASGLAVVLLRGVWERRGELALLRALGYRHRALGRLVLAENAFLLLVGLGAGVGSAVLAVAPHREAGAGPAPWPRLAAMLGLVLVVGLLAGFGAVRATLRAPLVPALRRE